MKQKSAFTLIELSVVIVIISILITGVFNYSKTIVKNSNNKVTTDKLNAIYKALTTFVGANRRLPCPADITKISTDSGFGYESGDPAACAGGGNTFSGNLVYGMLPVASLGLNTQMVTDGFGTKFSYVVDLRFTKDSTNTTSNDGFEIIAGTPQGSSSPGSIISVKENSFSATDNITTRAIFAIISHGADKLGGYNLDKTTANTAPNSSSDEYNNTKVAISSTLVNSSTNTTYTFDDILLFKTKAQLVYDSKLRYIMCSKNESSINTTYTSPNHSISWPSASYNNSVTNSTGSCTSPAGSLSRYCGQYGMWGDFYCDS